MKKRTLLYFGSILPPGEKKSDNEIKFYEFTEEQMKQITLVGKPLKDEHGNLGRSEKMGSVIFSNLGEDGRMYVIGEVTDDIIIDEILSGKKLGLSMNHDYQFFPLPGKGWVDYKKITEVSFTDVPSSAREGHSILSFFLDDNENFSDNLSDEIISSQDNLHREKTEENLEENLEMSSASTDSTPPPPMESSSQPAEPKKGEPLSEEQAKTMLEAVTKFKRQADDAEDGLEKFKKENEELRAQHEQTKKQNEELKAIDDRRTSEQNNKLIQTFTQLVKKLGIEETLTESDLPKPGEAWTSDGAGKFTDSFVAAAACAERELDQLRSMSEQFEQFKDVVTGETPTKRKRFREPSQTAQKSKVQEEREAEVSKFAEMIMGSLPK